MVLTRDSSGEAGCLRTRSGADGTTRHATFVSNSALTWTTLTYSSTYYLLYARGDSTRESCSASVRVINSYGYCPLSLPLPFSVFLFPQQQQQPDREQRTSLHSTPVTYRLMCMVYGAGVYVYCLNNLNKVDTFSIVGNWHTVWWY